MYQIREWLYISGFTAASDEKWLKHTGIQAMLQLFKPLYYPGIHALYLQAEDGYPLQSVSIARGTQFIREQAQLQHHLLITCGAGISRSVTFGIAALKEIEGVSLRQAYLSIRKKHPDAMPDQRHWESLRAFYGEEESFWDVWKDLVMRGGA